MAEEAQIQELILLVGQEMLTPQQFSQVIDLNDGNMTRSAAQVWEIRAGRYHGLVNISESGSSRNMGDMYKNAIEMAKYYRQKAAEEEEGPGAEDDGVTRTRAIVRP